MRSVARIVVSVAVLCLSAAPTRAAGPWTYLVTGPGGSNSIGPEQIGQVLYFQLDATVPDYVWGNVRVDFDPTILECVSIEETPFVEGFWTAWVAQAADPAYGGGGVPYFYDGGGQGSDWAQAWVATYGPGVAGPVASYDNAAGIIRFYTFTNAGGYAGSVPLRIGFLVKRAGTAAFTTSANDWTSFGWPTTATAGSTTTASGATLAAETTAAGEGYSWNLEDLPYRTTSEVTILAPAPAVRIVRVDVQASGNCSRAPSSISATVFGEPDLDVTAIDLATASLEGMPVKTAGKDGRFMASYGDADGDGLLDLGLVFTNTLGISGTAPARLAATLRDGKAIEGADAFCGP